MARTATCRRPANTRRYQAWPERREVAPMKGSNRVDIQGHVSVGFEAVRDAFTENFSQRRELGGACCVYHRGRRVVDLCVGVRSESTGEPWREDTMVPILSATKGSRGYRLCSGASIERHDSGRAKKGAGESSAPRHLKVRAVLALRYCRSRSASLDMQTRAPHYCATHQELTPCSDRPAGYSARALQQ
jgi:hypothetical protein